MGAKGLWCLLPHPCGGVGGHEAATHLGCMGAGRDLPQWLLPAGGTAWGQWV